MELIEFLRARLDDDQAAAEQMARYFPSPWEVIDRGYVVTIKAAEPDFRTVLQIEQERLPRLESGWLSEFVDHVARHDPARVLAEVEAKRALLEAHGALGHLPCDAHDGATGQTEHCDVVRLLGMAYRDHSDYDAARWAP